jgi:hypothetical protein
MLRRSLLLGWLVLAAAPMFGCEDSGQVSAKHAQAHVQMLVKTSQDDVEEIRRGLPEGAKLLAPLYGADKSPADNREAVRDGLAHARSKVQDLRVAKATFFALVDAGGKFLRNDQEQDLMADRDAFGPFPGLKQALGGKYVETRGLMEEARGVAKPRADGQWVAGAPVEVDGKVRGIYVAGWAWSSYAYRLEFKLRGQVRAELVEQDDSRKNEPLIYVYLLVDGKVFGAPVSPDINMETLGKLDLPSKVKGDAPVSQVLDITGRTFGLATERAPALGEGVLLSVLRSET